MTEKNKPLGLDSICVATRVMPFSILCKYIMALTKLFFTYVLLGPHNKKVAPKIWAWKLVLLIFFVGPATGKEKRRRGKSKK